MFEEGRLKLGIFVITGVTTLVIFLFLLGLKDVLKNQFEFYTVFEHSVQGLEVGSPVKFKGVHVGSVTKISIYSKQNLIKVIMELDGETFDGDSNSQLVGNIEETLNEMIEKGLGCEQKLTGITGMKIIEINYFPEDKTVKKSHGLKDSRLYLPSRPSSFDSTLLTVTEVLAKIGKIDFDKIGSNLEQTLSGIRSFVNEGELDEISTLIKETIVSVKTLTLKVDQKLDDVDVKGVSKKLEAALNAYKVLADEVSVKLAKLDLDKISKASRVAVLQATESVKHLEKALDETLKKTTEGIQVVTDLINTIEEDPSSIIRGKQTEPLFK